MKDIVLQFMKLADQGDSQLHKTHNVCRFYEVADKEAWLAEHAASVRAVVTSGHEGITDTLVNRLPNLGIVAIAGVGYEKVNLGLARSRGIRVSNTPDVLTEDVADAAIGLMISSMRHFQAAGQYVRTGQWPVKGDMGLATKASGRRYGILGLGRIGLAIGARLEGFGGSIAYSSRQPKSVAYAYHETLLDLAKAVDVLFVTVPGGAETRHAINRDVFDALGPKGFLINVARGSIVDEVALVAALVDGRLGGVGLDVFENEPSVPPALFDLPNVALTPHIGSATNATREVMAQVMLSNLDAYFTSAPLPTPVV